MDLLDRVAVPGADLLARVDGVLARSGAPAGHPVLALLRSVGTLPSTVLADMLTLDPQALTLAATRITATSGSVRDAIGQISTPPASAGAAAEHFGAAWRRLAAQVADDGSDGTSDLAGRIAATAAHLNALAVWAADARHEFAIELGTCLGSTEAVTIRADAAGGPDPAVIRAAAEIGVRILGAVARSVEAAWRECAIGQGLIDVVPLAAYDGSATPGNVIEIR